VQDKTSELVVLLSKKPGFAQAPPDSTVIEIRKSLPPIKINAGRLY
jgi:hypothetical protein